MDPEPTVAGEIRRELHRASVQSPVPGLTAGELAERLDVTERTIHNHIDDALERDGIYKRQVGNGTLYWYSTDVTNTKFGLPYGEDPEDNWWYLTWEDRGRWLGARRALVADAAKGVSLRRRVRWVGTLLNYARNLEQPAGLLDMLVLHRGDEMAADADAEGTVDPPTPAEMYAYLEEERGVDRDTALHYLEAKTYFEVPGYGEVTGLAEFCKGYVVKLEYQLHPDGSRQIDWDDVDEEELEEYVPTAAELLEVGDAIDTMVAEMFDVRF
jgi:predicted transcriptional regulator